MNTPTGKNNSRRGAGFTLVEMIMVMAIMVILLSAVFPSLKGFFHGRNLDNEARRFLSLTRYGQSWAIADGVPVELWINPRSESYGLEAVAGYTETQTNPMVYPLDQTLKISFSASSSVLLRSNYWTQAQAQFGAVVKIRFQPDGFISDSSPENVYLRQDTGDKATDRQIWIAETPTHLRYEIQFGQPPRR